MHTDQPLACWFPTAIWLLLTQPSSRWVRILPLGSLCLTSPGPSSSSHHPSLLDTTFLCFTPMADATFEANRVSCPLHEFSQFCSAFLWVYENWTCSFSAIFAAFCTLFTPQMQMPLNAHPWPSALPRWPSFWSILSHSCGSISHFFGAEFNLLISSVYFVVGPQIIFPHDRWLSLQDCPTIILRQVQREPTSSSSLLILGCFFSQL